MSYTELIQSYDDLITQLFLLFPLKASQEEPPELYSSDTVDGNPAV